MPSLDPRVRVRHASDLLRYRRWRTFSPRRLRNEIERLAESREPIRLQVGSSGFRLSGWLNTDIIHSADYFLDATAMRLVPSTSVDYLFGEHFIEHLTLEEARRFAAEALRVLKPGGVLRLSTPDLEALTKAYVDRSPDLLNLAKELHGRGSRGFGTWAVSAINQQAYSWSHRFLHDVESLSAILADAGFESVERRELGKSPLPDLQDIEQHEVGTALDPFMLVVEALRK